MRYFGKGPIIQPPDTFENSFYYSALILFTANTSSMSNVPIVLKYSLEQWYIHIVEKNESCCLFSLVYICFLLQMRMCAVYITYNKIPMSNKCHCMILTKHYIKKQVKAT